MLHHTENFVLSTIAAGSNTEHCRQVQRLIWKVDLGVHLELRRPLIFIKNNLAFLVGLDCDPGSLDDQILRSLIDDGGSFDHIWTIARSARGPQSYLGWIHAVE